MTDLASDGVSSAVQKMPCLIPGHLLHSDSLNPSHSFVVQKGSLSNKYTPGLCLRPWELRGDFISPQHRSLVLISCDFLVTGGGRENPGSNAVNILCMA